MDSRIAERSPGAQNLRIIVKVWSPPWELIDVMDPSHHWIGAILAQTILWVKCFGRIPRTIPFLGAATALPCVVGRRLAISNSKPARRLLRRARKGNKDGFFAE